VAGRRGDEPAVEVLLELRGNLEGGDPRIRLCGARNAGQRHGERHRRRARADAERARGPDCRILHRISVQSVAPTASSGGVARGPAGAARTLWERYKTRIRRATAYPREIALFSRRDPQYSFARKPAPRPHREQ